MTRTPVIILLINIVAGTAMLAETGYANPAAGAIPANAADQGIQSVQYGPGSGTGTGRVRCRIVVVPGSGRGPQRVCEPIPRCRTVVIPGSGLGPQRVCD
jgi:hypothetical protein